MKTVVITGSARGFGYAMIELFRKNNFNVVVCDVNEKYLQEAVNKLNNIKSDAKILPFHCDITNEDDVKRLIDNTLKETNTIDIWINNAGVNQPNLPIWQLEQNDINRLIDIDLKGTILCSRLIMNVMNNQHSGQIYNVEGFGSNNSLMTGLSIYGTTKRAITYFTEALAHECKEMNNNVLIGKITPGIMITNFITTSLGDKDKIELSEKTKKVYNILGDYPETIANFMVDKIIKNKKNNVKFAWLTSTRAFFRFASSSFNKRDFFK